jgi:uncharacterized protein YabE (DUF348 family)
MSHTVSDDTKHVLFRLLEQAGLSENLARKIIESPDNKLARDMVELAVKNGFTVQLPMRGRERAVQLRREHVEKLLETAKRAMDSGLIDRVQEACEQILVLEPNHEQALAFLDRSRSVLQNHLQEQTKAR